MRASIAHPTDAAIDAQALHRAVGRVHHVLTPPPLPGHALMRGRFSNGAVRAGINLHCTDIVQLQEMRTCHTMNEAGLKILIRLQGQAQVCMDDQSLPFEHTYSGPQGVVLALRSPAQFVRHAHGGDRQRMVVLTVAQDWLDAQGLAITPTLDSHLSMQRWVPSRRAVALTEQLLHPSAAVPALARLHQESQTLELITQALAPLVATPTAHMPLGGRALERMRRLQELLHSTEADTMDMATIAREVGSNATTLQQEFRHWQGQSIFEYLRALRLRRAHTALQQHGVRVAQAAELAGYSSQANFSTAFRRHFGVAPKHVRPTQ